MAIDFTVMHINAKHCKTGQLYRRCDIGQTEESSNGIMLQFLYFSSKNSGKTPIKILFFFGWQFKWLHIAKEKEKIQKNTHKKCKSVKNGLCVYAVNQQIWYEIRHT